MNRFIPWVPTYDGKLEKYAHNFSASYSENRFCTKRAVSKKMRESHSVPFGRNLLFLRSRKKKSQKLHNSDTERTSLSKKMWFLTSVNGRIYESIQKWECIHS